MLLKTPSLIFGFLLAVIPCCVGFDIINQNNASIAATPVGEFSPGDIGLVTTTDDGLGVKLTGQVRKAFSLDSTTEEYIEVNKFTRMRFKLVAEEAAATKGICLYRQEEEEEFTDLKVKCFMLNGEDNVVLPSNVEKITGDLITTGESRENLALGKSATQSSTYNRGDASKAVDGDRTSEFDFSDLEKNTVTHTKSELSPFWEVDLGGDFEVNQIIIYKRMDGYNGRLFDFNVTIYDSEENETFQELFDTLTTEATIPVDTGGKIGRRVRIQLNDDGVERVLCLAEVEIFGNSFQYDVAIGKLLLIPPTIVNRLGFIQQNQDSGSALSILSDFQFESGQEDKYLSSEWRQNSIGTADNEINIQGTGFITRSYGESKIDSPGVRFIAVKDPINQNKILIYTGGNTIISWEDPFDEVINFAISDEGLMVASFKKNTAGAVRILRVNGGAITKKDELIGTLGYGEGLSITPDGGTVAIGNPIAREVYIVSLDENGNINRNSDALTTIKPPGGLRDIDDKFGDKIGLSSSGHSIAIAAPSSDGESPPSDEELDIGVTNAGRIYISVFKERSNSWESNKVVLYGLIEGRMLGGGGVAIIDTTTGRIDVNDSLGDTLSFNYHVTCSDPNGIPSGRNDNAFDPWCICGENFKSTNDSQGKILRENIDVCVECESEEGMGDCVRGADGPTAAPTIAPTTASPSEITSSPSDGPSVNKDPSVSPSNIPSFELHSLFDGQPCNYDGECQQDRSCKSNICDPKALSITTKNGDDSEVNLDLSLSTPIPITDSPEGVLVEGSTIGLNGRVEVVYELAEPITISKLTFLQAKVESLEETTGLKICPREKKTVGIAGCEELPFKEITSEDKFGFSPKSLLMRFVAFKQLSGKSKISNIKLVTFQKGVIDEEGECVDDNAEREGPSCVCKPSYVVWPSLTEAKTLRVGDFCRTCDDTDECSYDGGACEDRKQSCYDNICDNGKCTPQDLSIKNDSGDVINASFLVDNNVNASSYGGVSVMGNEISLFGIASQIYELDETVMVNKYTKLGFSKYTHPSKTDAVSVSLCLYQTRHDAENDIGDFCVKLDASSNSLNVGKDIFLSRLADVKYMKFKQTTTHEPQREIQAKIQGVNFKQGEVMSVLLNNECVDPHAELLDTNECRCKLGYVASNGGRILTDIDTCVQCTNKQCNYDGDACVDDWDCYSGKCSEEKVCTPPRSLLISSEDINGESSPIETTIKLSPSGMVQEGGVLVGDSGELIMFGDVTQYFQLVDPIPISRFTKAKLNIVKTEDDSSINPEISICLYDNFSPLNCPASCHKVEWFDDNYDFPIEELIAYRDGELKSIAIKQQKATGVGVTIEDIRILAKPIENERSSDENCGQNALKVTLSTGGGNYASKCKCLDGFMSTDVNTKNKLLRDQDKCVSCIDLQECSLSGREGEPCVNELITDMFLGGLKSEPQRHYAKMVGTYPPDEYKNKLFLETETGNGGSFTNERKTSSNQEEEEDISYGTITLNGYVSNLFQLQTKYTVDKFSSIYFEASISSDASSLVVCFDGSITVHNTTNILCVSLNGEMEKWNNIEYPILSSNIAMGKFATTDSALEPNTLESFATDGNKTVASPVFETLLQDFPWWEVDLEREFEIDRIEIYLEEDESIDKLSDYNVGVYDSNGRLVYDYYGEKTNDILFTKTIDRLPQNIKGRKIRITMNDENRILALKEVEIFERVHSGRKLFEIPIGRLREGMEIEHIAFIQRPKTKGNAPSTISNLQNFNFVYGSFNPITPSPSISPLPTTSMPPTSYPSSSPTSSAPTNTPSVHPSSSSANPSEDLTNTTQSSRP